MPRKTIADIGKYLTELTALCIHGKISRATWAKNLVDQNQWVPSIDNLSTILVMERYAVAEEMEWRRQRYEDDLASRNQSTGVNSY